jgi:hypothetical protein
MPATRHELDESVVRNEVGMPVRYYPPRLSEADLQELEVWARYCQRQEPVAPLLSAYLHCLVEFENERRAAIEEGGQIVEAYLMPLPTHRWSNGEVIAAMSKLDAITRMADSEVGELLGKLFTLVLVEAMHRLENC